MAELKLSLIWEIRTKLRAEGTRLWAEGTRLRAEGTRLWAEGTRLWAEGTRLRAEGDKLWAEGTKLRAEGDKLWAEAVIEVYGNIKMEWIFKSEKDNYQCNLETPKGVEIFEP